MRLFIAINFNEEIKSNLVTTIQELKKSSMKGNFTHRENLHLTLAFIGEVGSDKVGQIKSQINGIKAEPFQLILKGLGKFKRNGGDIYWVGVEKNEILISINKYLVEELRNTGYQIEIREFSPHLTIGREVVLNDSVDTNKISEITLNKKMTVSRISLMKSERINGKLIYTEVYGKELVVNL